MQVPYDVGVAIHIGPESCAVAREGLGCPRLLCTIWRFFAKEKIPKKNGNYTLDSHLNCAMVPSLGIAQIGLGDGENAGEDAYLLACGMA